MTQTPPTMIEAVSRAIDPNAWLVIDQGLPARLDETEVKDRLFAQARAAIEAMKTPGDAMHSMIQAALGEKG